MLKLFSNFNMPENEVKKEETSSLSDKKKKKKSGLRKYLLYISLVLIATGLSLFLSLKDNFNLVVEAFTKCDYRWIAVIVAVMVFAVIVDGLVITIFMRLYTRKYHLHQGMAVSMIGSFYSGITPGASGGQVMQAYTLKKQGTQISNAASLLVMYFIIYQVALIVFDIVTVSYKANLLQQIGSIPITLGNWHFSLSLAPLTILGFLLNLSIIGLLFLMSYSHRIHNFIMHYGVGLLAKLHILKHPDKTRESLRIQVENFKIELRRLLSNFRVSFIIFILLFIGLMCRFSIPWFAGMALNGYSETTTGGPTVAAFWDACFMSSYHQMVTGLIPLPGGAGVSELFFSSLFQNYYKNAETIAAAQIIWRTATFYLVLLVSGFVSALYKASPKEQALEVDRKTFVTMQFETYEERKKSSDTLYETSQMSRKELQNRLRDVLRPKAIKDRKEKKNYKLDDTDLKESSPFAVDDEFIPKKKNKKKKHHDDDIEWRDFDIK